MKIRIFNRIFELNTTGSPDDQLWQEGMCVSLGRRWFVNSRLSFYLLIWEYEKR